MTHYSMTTITGTCFFCPKTFFFKNLHALSLTKYVSTRYELTEISRLDGIFYSHSFPVYRKRHRVVLFLLFPALDVYKRLLEIRNDFCDHNDIWCRIAHKALNSYDENSNVYWCFRQNHSQFTRNVQESADPENFSSERFFIQSIHILVNLQCE